jgi:hypothetical protein
VSSGVSHLYGERLSVPGVNGPDFTSERDSVSTGVDVSVAKGSPELVSGGTLAITAVVLMALAHLRRSAAIVLPQSRWVMHTFIVVAFLFLISIVKLILHL